MTAAFSKACLSCPILGLSRVPALMFAPSRLELYFWPGLAAFCCLLEGCWFELRVWIWDAPLVLLFLIPYSSGQTLHAGHA